eukprot:667527_1
MLLVDIAIHILLFFVISYSLGIFITLSIVMLFCYKLVQVNWNKEWCNTKQHSEYTSAHGLDLVSIGTKHTILVFAVTLCSFAMLFLLIMIFGINLYDVSLLGQRQFLDICLLLNAYITSICVLFTFKYLHRKYVYCFSCLDGFCKHSCNKYSRQLSISLNISQELQLTAMVDDGIDDEVIELLGDHRDRHVSRHEGVPVRPLRSTSVMGKEEHMDDMLRRLHMQQHLNAPSAPPQHPLPRQQNIYRNISNKAVCGMLIQRGFNKGFTLRGIKVYEEHYGNKEYDLAVVEEIIYRLAVKDKLKQLTAVQNLYQSRQGVHEILSNLNFSSRYIHLAMLLYEVMAEMVEIVEYHQNIYDLKVITELIMRLRVKFTDYGDLREKSQPLRSYSQPPPAQPPRLMEYSAPSRRFSNLDAVKGGIIDSDFVDIPVNVNTESMDTIDKEKVKMQIDYKSNRIVLGELVFSNQSEI